VGRFCDDLWVWIQSSYATGSANCSFEDEDEDDDENECRFRQALSAALLKKQVPVRVTTDRKKATHILLETHEAKQEGQGERIAKVMVLGGFAGSAKTFEATLFLTDRDGIVFAHNMKKSNFHSAAEGIAQHLKNHVEEGAR